MQAAPRLSEDKVKQCVDARLGGDYPPKAIAKVNFLRLRTALTFWRFVPCWNYIISRIFFPQVSFIFLLSIMLGFL